MAVVDDDGGQILHLQAVDGLGAEIREGHHGRGLDALGDQRPRAPGGAEIHRGVFLEGRQHLGASFPLADHGLEPQLQHGGGVGVHAGAGGGAGRADNPAGPGRAGAYIVQNLPLEIHRQRLAGLEQFHEPLVGRVPGRIDDAVHQDLVTCHQGPHHLIGQGRR